MRKSGNRVEFYDLDDCSEVGREAPELQHEFDSCPYCKSKNFDDEFLQDIRDLHRHVFSIVGAHGVGKTTLVNRLCTMIDEATALQEVVRDCPFPIGMRQSFDTSEWIASEHVRRVLFILYAARDLEKHILICDRSEYDPFLYCCKRACMAEASLWMQNFTCDEFIAKPYRHHIILFDDDSCEPCDPRSKEKKFFWSKRTQFCSFFTTFFSDILIIDRKTDIESIVAWIRGRVSDDFGKVMPVDLRTVGKSLRLIRGKCPIGVGR